MEGNPKGQTKKKALTKYPFLTNFDHSKVKKKYYKSKLY